MVRFRGVIAICTLIWLAAPAPALAEPPDTEALLTRLDAMLAENGFNAEFGPVESATAGDFHIAYVHVTGRGSREPARVDDLTIAGADLADDGTLTIERMAFARIARSGKDKRGREVTMSFDGGEFTGLYFPDSQNGAANLVADRKTEWQVGRTIVTIDSAVAVIVEGMRGTAEPDATRQALTSTAEIDRLRLDPYAFGEPRVAKRAGELEILTLDLSFQVAARWNAATGRMAIERWHMEAPGLGVLDLSLELDGYTGDRVRQMRGANIAASANAGDSAAEMREAGKELMSALGAITVVEGTLRFEDRSLVRRLLEARAKADDRTVGELVQLLPDQSLSFTQLLEMPEFSQMVADALRAFLADPESMTVKLRPPAPMPVAGMIAMALFSPGALIQQLGIEITANE